MQDVFFKNKRKLTSLALQEYITHHSRRDVRELIGKVKLRENYAYKALPRDNNDKEALLEF